MLALYSFSLILSAFAGVSAVAAYLTLTLQFGRRSKPKWAAYFGALLFTETLFSLVWGFGLILVVAAGSGALPPAPVGLWQWTQTITLLYAVPVSVMLSALGWFFAQRTNEPVVYVLTEDQARLDG